LYVVVDVVVDVDVDVLVDPWWKTKRTKRTMRTKTTTTTIDSCVSFFVGCERGVERREG
jgi:hypothetical protein